MNSQKKPARKSAKPDRTTSALITRANEIIDDSRQFDADTRYFIKVAVGNLEFSLSDNPLVAASGTDYKEEETILRELIRKVEAGEPLFNETEIGQEHVTAARMIYNVIEETNGVPSFIYNAVMLALDEAARLTGCRIWIDEADIKNGGYSIERIARLFAHHPTLGVELEPKKDLAQMIADVFNHPDCPGDIRDGLDRGTSDLFNTLNEGAGRVYKTAPYIRALIMEHKAQEGDAK